MMVSRLIPRGRRSYCSSGAQKSQRRKKHTESAPQTDLCNLRRGLTGARAPRVSPRPVFCRSEGIYLSFAHLTSSGGYAPVTLPGRIVYLSYAFTVWLILSCYIGAPGFSPTTPSRLPQCLPSAACTLALHMSHNSHAPTFLLLSPLTPPTTSQPRDASRREPIAVPAHLVHSRPRERLVPHVRA